MRTQLAVWLQPGGLRGTCPGARAPDPRAVRDRHAAPVSWPCSRPRRPSVPVASQPVQAVRQQPRSPGSALFLSLRSFSLLLGQPSCAGWDPGSPVCQAGAAGSPASPDLASSCLCSFSLLTCQSPHKRHRVSVCSSLSAAKAGLPVSGFRSCSVLSLLGLRLEACRQLRDCWESLWYLSSTFLLPVGCTVCPAACEGPAAPGLLASAVHWAAWDLSASPSSLLSRLESAHRPLQLCALGGL